MQCLSCGAFLPDAAKFCAECGAAALLALPMQDKHRDGLLRMTISANPPEV
jgi:rRNA maturation endonuclease Nob1